MMLECLLLGDSIAAGTYIFRRDCLMVAETGIDSKKFNKKYTVEFRADSAIISLGSNDTDGIDTKKELLYLRRHIKAKKVYWIMPAVNPDVQQIIEDVANQHHDWIVKIPYLSADGVHPTMKGYKKIGDITKP